MTDSVRFGYTLMTEQSGARELLGYTVDAERAGCDFEVSSDHSPDADFKSWASVNIYPVRVPTAKSRSAGILTDNHHPARP